MQESKELSVISENAPEPRRYSSIFENPAEFAQKMQIAEALSRTQFVPAAFRGKPEDCLVALDAAGRLDLNPLAVLPEIYVIDNRASFSSKFLISLVNRSGRFSRIEFEEGFVGVAEVTFAKFNKQTKQNEYERRKVDNYYAIARFTELATGKEFRSPRVDMEFAERNGWVAKAGSKWQSMPEIMCRYRSAAILIKSVCPEIVMGFEFAEDLMDASEEPHPEPARRVYVEKDEPRPAIAPASTQDAANKAGELLKEITAAESLADLKKIGGRITAARLNDGVLKTLRAAYARRRDELTPAPAAPTAETGVDPAIIGAALQKDIEAAKDAEALGVIARNLVALQKNGSITDSVYFELGQLIDERVAALAPNV